jgi:16S rRNA (cytidine1402-2'-O)-methyltransferase
LPVDKKKREKTILTLERRVQSSGKTQIFIEAPHRNDILLDEIIRLCDGNTKLCVAVNLTLRDEMIVTRSIDKWKKNKLVIGKNPAIFLIGV